MRPRAVGLDANIPWSGIEAHAMTRLNISLLGPFHIHRDGLPEIPLAYDKVRALLAYLAIEADHPHRRETLAELLWPEQDERAARHSLSQALFSLRHAIGDRDAADSLLLLTRDTVRLNPASAYWLDTQHFADLLETVARRQKERERHSIRTARLDRGGARLLEQAVGLWRGQLLEQMPASGSAAFDEWLLITREQLQQRAIWGLGMLVEHYEWRGDSERACACARRLLALDPWREDVVRRLMRMLASTGQRAAALEEYERCRSVLRDELDLEPEPETTELWRQLRTGRFSAVEVSRPRGISGALPSQPAFFVGRGRELRDLQRLLDADDSRLVTLVGPGGIGKTQLALRAAMLTCDSFAHGACFVALAGLDTPELLPHAVAAALGLTLDGRGDAGEQLVAALRERELLLVLDSFEHLLDGTGLLGALLAAAPDVRLIVTSRERLELRDEWVLEVTGLSLPDTDDTESIEASSAAQLFLHCARRASASERLLPVELPAVARLCRVLSGMPLGIELAASWTPMMTFTEIAAEVEASLDFLSARVRDMPERHRSMRAVFDQSWGRLTETERRAFRRLAVFRNGFQRDTAEQVTGTTLAVLSALVAKSLVRLGESGRYDMHELLRQYGAQRLDETVAEANTVRDAHGEHFTGFLAEREAALKGPLQAVALAEISAESENIRAAWHWAVRNRQAGQIARAMHALWLHGEITGRYRETQALVAAAVTAFSDHAVETDAGQEQSPAKALALGRGLVSHGSYFIRLGDYEQGRRLVEQGMAVLRPLAVPGDLGLARNFQGMYAVSRRDYEQAASDLRESIRLFEMAGDDWGLGYSLNDLGLTMMLRGDDATARQLGQRSLALFRRIGDRRGLAFALHNLGLVALRLGDLEAAREHFSEALAVRREIGHTWGLAATLIQLGVLERLAGADEAALGYLALALEAAAVAQSRPTTMSALIEVAALLLGFGGGEQSRAILTAITWHPDADDDLRERGRVLLGAHGMTVGITLAPESAMRVVEEYASAVRQGRLALAALVPQLEGA